jgi:hypothetical protein
MLIDNLIACLGDWDLLTKTFRLHLSRRRAIRLTLFETVVLRDLHVT